MKKLHMLLAVLREFGVRWAIDRGLYSLKLRLLGLCPAAGRLFEKAPPYPVRTDLFRVDVSALRSILSELDEADRRQLIETADNACRGVIRGFSSLDLDYGDPIDWQRSPLTGKRCSEKQRWHRIPDFDGERGDIKVIWEASRFSHFITLARAFLLTGEERYHEAFSEQLDAWLRDNPYGYGANFKCGQECALRMVNALLASAVFRETGALTQHDEDNLKELTDRCYRKILSNFFYAYRCIKNNHTISELMGMIAGAWCSADRRLDRAFRLLDEVVAEQLTEDGGYRQFSFNYQRLALQDLECVLSMESVVGRRLSEDSRARIRNAALLMFQCQDAQGDMPNYGSNDGALAFPVTSCGYRDFRPVVNGAYALTAGKQLYGDGPQQEELIWFSGGRPLDAFGRELMERASAQFPSAGLFTLRAEKTWAMLVANDYHSRPAHMDQLHLDLWIGGVNVLCDCGTYSYAGEPGRELVQAGSHNTLAADGRPQMNARGPFLIFDRTKLRRAEASAASFEGEVTSANGYTHRRRVVMTETGLEITDETDKDGYVLFHTPCAVEPGAGGAILKSGERTVCRLVSSGEITVEKAVRSLYYLKKDEIRRIAVRIGPGRGLTTRIETEEGERFHG